MARANKLKISKEVHLPSDAVTQTMAMIGRKGAGKTYLGTMIAEQMLDMKTQVAVIDPVGVWWGLRIDADGKTKGKEIFVIGGDHGDVPLVPEAGRKIAQLLVEKGISAVIDVSEFGIGERKRFCADFGEEFFQLKKKNRSPVHVFMEEAQLLVPQNIRANDARMYSAYEQIVRLGRNYGIGSSLITQRPQSVNKEVLSQVECLCVLQITGPHERKALEFWVQEAGIDKPRTLIGELPGLNRGEGYVWSPAWLKLFERVNFSKKKTFDASATPKLGQKAQAASLSAVDVKALKKDLEEVVEQAEKDDPAALRRKIVQLETELRKKGSDPESVEKAVNAALLKREREYDKERSEMIRISGLYIKTLEQIGKSAGEALKLAGKEPPQIFTATAPKINPLPKDFGPGKIISIKSESPKNEPILEDQPIDGPQQKVLDAIAWMNSVGVGEPEKAAVGFVAGYSPRSSGFQNACGSLRSKGLVEYRGKSIVLTGNGQAFANEPDGLISNEDLHQRILDKLPGPERSILRDLIENYSDEPVSKEDTATRLDKSSASSGFQNACGRLRTLGLITYPAPGHMMAADILFPL